MLRNYLNVALRNIKNNAVFSFINVVGLSLGMAAFMLIMQYVSFERSYNTFHQKRTDAYRVLQETKEGKIYDYSTPVLATQAHQQFGEITNYCRIAEGIGNGIVSYAEGESLKSFKEEHVAYTDGSFFTLFSFPVHHGNSALLNNPNTIALSAAVAERYFNKQPALGKVLTINNEFGENVYTVVAVYHDFPENSDLQFDMILSLQTLANPANLHGSDWASLDGSSSYLTTYLQFQPQANIQQVEKKIQDWNSKTYPDEENKLRLQPLSTIHLAASLDDTFITYGNLGFVYLLQGIAALILVIAWFNYINLSTAAALKRAKEVGLRKVVGASKAQLIKQFLGESLFLNLTGLLLAITLVSLVQPLFNQLIGKTLSLAILTQNFNLLMVLISLLVGAFTSGMYTAFVLSSFNPAQTLKGVFSKSFKGAMLRKTLVVFQFSISIILIISTLVMYRQLQFMQTEKLGMNIRQLMVINGPRAGLDSTYRQRKESFKNELAKTNFIEKYCGSGSVPTQGYNYSTANITRLSPAPGDDKTNYAIAYVDELFFPTYEIQFAAGQNFLNTDCIKAATARDRLIINEQALHQLGFHSAEESIGQKIKWYDKEYEIHGVVKDYHHLSLKQTIAPTIFVPQNASTFFTIKLQSVDMIRHKAYLEKIFQAYFPGNPFEFFFVDDNYNRQYLTEQNYGLVFTTASCLAIFIACLGLFGLATFTAEQRTKEIGIRKILGAQVSQIAVLLSKDFLTLVLIAISISIPVAWWGMNKWLQDFAYRTELSIWVFILAGCLVIAIAILTVGVQAIKTAMANPTQSLRNE